MAAAVELPNTVRRYLHALELELKQVPGLVPEDALSDAREYLTNEAAALERSGEGLHDDAHYQWMIANYGTPAEVARQYAVLAPPFRARKGNAPGWRICCTRCGRSAPLASIGSIRRGAKSVHKYTLGYCRECKGLRFLRIHQDLDTSNLTQQLGVTKTPEELRRQMHRPVATLLLLLAMVITSILAGLGVLLLIGTVPTTVTGQEPDVATNAVGKLSEAIRLHYSYVDLHKVDWVKRLETYRPKLDASKTSIEFAHVAAEYLREARDIHIWLKAGDKTIATHQRDAALNFNPRILPKILPKWKQHGKTVITGETQDGFSYVLISTWDQREPESMKAAIDAVRESAKNKKALILDVRPNSGGDEMLARQVASYFVDRPTPYAAHSMRNNGQDLPLQKREIAPAPDGVRHSGPCMVLMGPTNMSSCESFLLMMRAAGAKLIGGPTQGSSGNPKPHDLGNGVIVFLPSWRSLEVDGSLLEGKGIRPDVLVETHPNDFATTDPVLEKACELLRNSSSK